ncbi:MAG: glycine cleavage system aminomethyltransferase GcvT [Candidatus Marinimicrobia bacterium]|nr:glycine cleavage system aminomethyltransferase GcvT [Candidatus Neomarinimicrobiota bacterium]MCF7840530.1 glycine cleavage system aminomethyltransferase GcvT [Candidatus Neomarinimicrobiota bacterium]
MKRTPFYEKHATLGAKLVDFAGYAMPVQYQSMVAEHMAVRQTAGLFDVSHMGEFLVTGPQQVEFLDYATINDIRGMVPGQAQYSAMCLESGGIVDDLLIYKFEDKFMLVVNASNIEKDWQHLAHLADSYDVTLENHSEDTALLALQGPNSRDILQKLADTDLSAIPFYHFREGKVAGCSMVIARTGYTGELGFELYHDPVFSAELWDTLMDAGQDAGLKPAGLGSRDSLRLEMKYCLYGNDIDETTTPQEARLGWITKMDKPDFHGKAALEVQKAAGLKRALIAFELTERGIPRHGYDIYVGDEKVGQVTSGGHSPVLEKGIGMGYVNFPHHKTGTEIFIDIRGRKIPAKIVKPPFVKNTTIAS